MKKIHVDQEARLARAEGGVTWDELDAATQAIGLATPGGVMPDTGIAGLTLGGLWEIGFGGSSNVMEVYFGYLRAKLEAEGESRLIHTVRGVGYILKE